MKSGQLPTLTPKWWVKLSDIFCIGFKVLSNSRRSYRVFSDASVMTCFYPHTQPRGGSGYREHLFIAAPAAGSGWPAGCRLSQSANVISSFANHVSSLQSLNKLLSSGPLRDRGILGPAHVHRHPQPKVWMHFSKGSITCAGLMSEGHQVGPPCGPIWLSMGLCFALC